eukprot:CAMPEP_0183332708 /NCGR_PEP_ID=MMETSP0164_2-20130417/1804_1 /TAXON_ID=221442 /ORGANISM="Coccolithus pelagicus ssp braarudi, Strain PLY182g" /LENGTH=133 /DNA_ID=CAMNT_0025501483 /DNA_START=417 /DNA_END=815 /DNA_ORIENTATION=-
MSETAEAALVCSSSHPRRLWVEGPLRLADFLCRLIVKCAAEEKRSCNNQPDDHALTLADAEAPSPIAIATCAASAGEVNTRSGFCLTGRRLWSHNSSNERSPQLPHPWGLQRKAWGVGRECRHIYEDHPYMHT